MSNSTICPICASSPRRLALSQVLLGRHRVDYWLCDACGLLQTEAPYWLDEAYESAIADTDTGILVRNLANARLLNMLLPKISRQGGRFIDIAGGYGVLTRLLRDRGFDCWRSDKYCENLFASNFEAGESMAADVLFAFEVLEHVIDPAAFLEEQFARHGCRSLIFSTQTWEGAVPPADWWYYSVETGQHISFYQPRTLGAIAKRLGCAYTAIDSERHIFTPAPLSGIADRVLRRRRIREWLERRAWERPQTVESLTWTDHLDAKQRLQTAARASVSD